jgi:ribosomal protein S18 acetylase RimI-like enzyme
MLQEAMNPISISQDHLLVAFDDDDPAEKLMGFGQIRPLDGVYSELASLYVFPDHRSKGIGGSLVEELLERYDKQGTTNAPGTVCLLALSETAPFYEKYGFMVVNENEIQSDLPSSLKFEYKAGSVLSSILGNDLVCMVRRRL